MDGRVVDAETGAPIPGALVIAEWSGDIGGPVQSSEVCFHMEVATTDAEGRYHIPGWSRRPVADWEGGFFGVRNVEVSRRTYKAGYTHFKYEPDNSANILMSRANGADIERIGYLLHSGSQSCGREDGSLLNELVLWTAICDEVKRMPAAREPNSVISKSSALMKIDGHIASVLSGSALQQYDPQKVTPATCSRG